MSIYTIGYEGFDMDNFLSLLRLGNIETVVDIRELPLSRKPGFSKRGLGETLNLNGMEYVHLVKLGCPKPIRDQYRDDGSWAKYKVGFLRYLKTQSEVIAELAELTSISNCALLCYEADFNFCHRSMVAEAVRTVNGMTVCHLQAAALKKAQSASLALAFA